MTFEKTFCAAPWFQARIDWDGRYRPCAEFNESNSEFVGTTQYSINDTTVDQWLSGEYSQYLRKELSQGNQLPECNQCWQKENNNITSTRQHINNTVTNNQGNNLDNTWVKLFVNRDKSYKNYKLISADVKLSNTCNFSCAMCSPSDSSKIYDHWKSDQTNKFVQEHIKKQPKYFENILLNYKTKRGYQHLKDILSHPITYLKVLGGEPLLDKELFNILKDQPLDKKSKICVHIVTNGSQDLISAADALKDYKLVSFTVSLEGIGNIQDYTRPGSNWNYIETNILNAKKNNILISIHHTLQAMTVLNLSELLLWCQTNQIVLSFGLLEHPEYLSIAVLPNNIRQTAIDNLSKIKNISILDSVDQHLVSIDNIKDLINSFPVDVENYKKFHEYVSWFEHKSILKLKNLQPDLYEN